MNKRLKAVIIVGAILLVITVGVGATLAYFTGMAEKQNNMQVGRIAGSIVEDQWAENPSVSTGKAVAKNPAVKNDDPKTSAYTRVKLVTSDSRIMVDCLDAGQNKLFTIGDSIANGTAFGDWIYEDGYFYCNQVLAAGATTSTLFSFIQVNTDRTDDIFVGKLESETAYPFEVFVMAELVQSSGMVEGSTPVEIAKKSFEMLGKASE